MYKKLIGHSEMGGGNPASEIITTNEEKPKQRNTNNNFKRFLSHQDCFLQPSLRFLPLVRGPKVNIMRHIRNNAETKDNIT